MEDLYYFTNQDASLSDIARLAEEAGYTCEPPRPGAGRSNIRIFNGGIIESRLRRRPEGPLETVPREDSWLWHHWRDWPGSDTEPENAARLFAYNPKSAFIISYRPGSLPVLKRFLMMVLQRYGGWVGDAWDWSRPFMEADIDVLE